MKVFKTPDGKVVDVIQHILEQIRKDPFVEIHVGTDSQNDGRFSKYASVIAFKFGTRGVHYLYSKTRFPRIKDRFSRLYREAEMTIEIAEWLSNKAKSVKFELDFDYNNDEKHYSQKLVSSTVGWAKGLGYKVNIKPVKQIATKAADKHCR